MSVVALVIAPSIALDAVDVNEYVQEKAATEVVGDMEISKDVRVTMKVNEDGSTTATVITTTIDNGEKLIKEQVFSGTEDEVKVQLEQLENIDTKIVKDKVIIDKGN